MKLQTLINKLEKHHKRKIDLSLERTYNLLKKLGNPQDKLKNVVTVVGTNSKASMCYSLKSILKDGYSIGIVGVMSSFNGNIYDIPKKDGGTFKYAEATAILSSELNVK